MTAARKLAFNPLPWIFTAESFELSPRTIRQALSELAPLGYDAVHADVPNGMSADEYLALIGEFGFRPAPGYFYADFTVRADQAAAVEAARVHAAQHAELGLTEAFVASGLSDERVARPAAGAAASAQRTAILADGFAAAAEAMRAEGVTAGLHSHVSSWVETEEETRAILDATAGSALGFGPDTGQLSWVGADLISMIRDYADRLVAFHLKDVDESAAAASTQAGADYFGATFGHHVWTEPGRGAIDFDAMFDAVPSSFAGWFVVEVDVPNLSSAAESARAAREYLLRRPYFAESASP